MPEPATPRGRSALALDAFRGRYLLPIVGEALELAKHELYEAGLTATPAFRAVAEALAEIREATDELLDVAHPIIRGDAVDEIAAWVEERSGSALANWIRREFGNG